jgi:DNA relaxase NicK
MYIVDGILKLDMRNFEVMPYGGRHGYRRGIAFNGIEIYYDGNSTTMGANVSMSGNGCKTYAQYHPMEELLQRIHEGTKEGEINPTRIDIACDDHRGLLDLKRIIEVIRERRLRARATHRKGIFNLDSAQGDEGDTVYIGSEKSEARIRIYDKAAEQGDYTGIWNRLEMVNRRDYARAVIEALVTSGAKLGEVVAGVLADRIAFIEKDDVNISRCSLASWWAEFLENITRIKLMLKEKPEMAIEKLAHFFGDELAACVWVLSAAFGDSFWQTVRERGQQKLRRRHLNLLRDYEGVSA